jgi:hypothetical protein
MQQASDIEMPGYPLEFQNRALPAAEAVPSFQTIGQFYEALKQALPNDGWTNTNQIGDETAFIGELFTVTSKADAARAIDLIVSEGEGTDNPTDESPLDFHGEVSH